MNNIGKDQLLNTLPSAIEQVTPSDTSKTGTSKKYIVLNKGVYEGSSIRSGKLSLGQLAEIVKDFVSHNGHMSESGTKGLGEIIGQSTESMKSWKFLILNFLTLGTYGVKFGKALDSLKENLIKLRNIDPNTISNKQDKEVVIGTNNIKDLEKQSSKLTNEIFNLKKELETLGEIQKNIPKIQECIKEINVIKKDNSIRDESIKKIEENIKKIEGQKGQYGYGYATERDYDDRLKGLRKKIVYLKALNESDSSWIPRTLDNYRYGVEGIETNLKDEFPTSSIKTIEDALEIPNKIEEIESKIKEKSDELKNTREKIASINKKEIEGILDRAFLNVKIK